MGVTENITKGYTSSVIGSFSLNTCTEQDHKRNEKMYANQEKLAGVISVSV